MSAGAAAAAAATREAAKKEAQRKRSEDEAAKRAYERQKKALSEGPANFAKAVEALKAQRAAEEAGKAKLRPKVAVLHDSSQEPIEVIGPSGKIYGSTSIFCLRPYHHPRKAAILICESRPFDPIIPLTIICNCITMAWESPLDPPGTPKEHFIDVCEWVYLYIFTFESTKVIAYG